jgi:hypothetical protein
LDLCSSAFQMQNILWPWDYLTYQNLCRLLHRIYNYFRIHTRISTF